MSSISSRSIVKLLTLPRYYELSINSQKNSFVVCRLIPISSKIQVNSRGNNFDRLTEVFTDQEQTMKNVTNKELKSAYPPTKSFSAFWPRVNWIESKISTKQGVELRRILVLAPVYEARLRKSSLYRNACYAG